MNPIGPDWAPVFDDTIGRKAYGFYLYVETDFMWHVWADSFRFAEGKCSHVEEAKAEALAAARKEWIKRGGQP